MEDCQEAQLTHIHLPMKYIIGISGYARAGKDTLADHLITELCHRGVVSSKFKFATALRRALTRACADIGNPIDFETDDLSRKAAIRPLMVEFGRVNRAHDPDCFVKRTHADIEKMFRIGCQVAVISDLRYLNEGTLTRELCLTHGWTYKHIDIERRGTFAANQEELDSIQQLLDAVHTEAWFSGVAFSDRDYAGISMLAAAIADEVARVVR